MSNDQNAEENQEATDVVKTLTPGENQTAPAAGPLQTPFPVSESGLGAAPRGPGLAASLFAESTELQSIFSGFTHVVPCVRISFLFKTE